jgi:predicted GNAT family acetyltransferase
VKDNAERLRYEVHSDDEVAGFTQYRLAPGAIEFFHTEIDPQFEGQGMGAALVRGALDDSRERGRAVLPTCPFVRGYISKHPEYLDLVPEDQRATFGL